jgi:hypothetical protein
MKEQHDVNQRKARWHQKRGESNLPRLPGKIEVTTAGDSNIPSIWRAIYSIKSSCVITCTTNTARNCSEKEMKKCQHLISQN